MFLAAAWDELGARFPEFATFSGIFANTAIVKRHGVKPFDWYLKSLGWPERTEAFLEGAEALFADVAQKALASAHLVGCGINTVVTVCSTGIANLSLEARVARAMGAFAPTSCACRCSASAAPAAYRACRLRRAFMAAAATPFLLPGERARFTNLATLDRYSLALMAISLASLEIGLKQAPQHGWLSPLCSLLFLASVATATAFCRQNAQGQAFGGRAVDAGEPLFCDRLLCLGAGLFGSVYLMPVFLAYVRRHDAFEIGTIRLVTGVSQLTMAPIAGAMESRLDPRLLSAAGFGLFALGLGCSAFQSQVADLDEMFWPQVLRASRSCSACCHRRDWRSAC
jgi:hypothetical protein